MHFELILFCLVVGLYGQFSVGLPQGPASSFFQRDTKDSGEIQWWKSSIIYQIYPRSFKDSDGDGTGDLKGIISKVDYLADLGIGAVWLSPAYVSPMADFGYDIANYTDIDPLFGSLHDLDDLLKKLHSKGIKLIMDFVPNHTSEEHEWFEKSLQREDPYTDYYVWEPPRGYNATGQPIPPNNWLGVFGFSAWEWVEPRQQFYLHQFTKEQPDLNVRNPLVLDELDNVLRFWLERGVDGFRVDALQDLFEVEDYSLDEPVAAPPTVTDPNDYHYLDHPYSMNRPETVEITRRWQKVLNEYGSDKMLIIEVYDADPYHEVKYYAMADDKNPVIPFNMHFISDLQSRSDVTGLKLKQALDIWLDNIEEGQWPNWVLGNHDRGRVASRLGPQLVDAMNMMVLLLQGTPTTYYGEEIGMENRSISYEEAIDPWALNYGPEGYQQYGRDPERTPMQWDNTSNAGFSTADSTWLPIHPNYIDVNVARQMEEGQSHLKVYKTLAKLRQRDTFTMGDMSFPMVNEQILTILRSKDDEASYLVIINTSEEEQTVDVASSLDDDVAEEATVEVRSVFDTRDATAPGSSMNLSAVTLLPSEGIVLRLE